MRHLIPEPVCCFETMGWRNSSFLNRSNKYHCQSIAITESLSTASRLLCETATKIQIIDLGFASNHRRTILFTVLESFETISHRNCDIRLLSYATPLKEEFRIALKFNSSSFHQSFHKCTSPFLHCPSNYLNVTIERINKI